MNAQNMSLLRPNIYQFRLGEFIVTNILEGHVIRNDLHPFVATNATATEVESVATAHHAPYPGLEHSFVCTVVQTPNQLIVFDPGFGENAPMPSAGFFLQSLADAGYSADDVDMVVISHSHPDHIGNLMTNNEPTFKNAQIVYGQTEFDFWERGENISDMRKPTQALFEKVALPLKERMRFVTPDESVVAGITTVNAFGHSAGHLVFHLESNEQQLLMLNDTVAHYVASFARPDWHFSMDDDPEAAAISRQRVLDMAATNQIPVIGFHVPFPAIGFVESTGKAFRFHPATYQFNLQI